MTIRKTLRSPVPSILGASLLVSCAAAAPAGAAEQLYVVKPVGPLPDQPGPTWARSINDAGTVLGGALINGSRASRGFLFDGETYTTIASDQDLPFIWPGALSGTEDFVGTRQIPNFPFGTKYEAFVGSPEFLPTLFPQFPSAQSSRGRDISDGVAGAAPWACGMKTLSATMGVGGFTTFNGYLVLLDGNPNPPVEIGALGGQYVRAEALNDSRDVVGASLTSTGPLRAFFRTAAGATTNLGTLGGSHSWAADINNLKQVVGWSRLADGSTHAFRWQSAVMTDLGTLGGDFSEACGVNEAGRIVGMSFNADARPRAFIHETSMIDLNGRIAPESGWILQRAQAINESGSIVGSGRFKGEMRGFLLTPRPPGDATLDGVVDIDDIFQVINGWGPCPKAPSLCPADFDGSGSIDVDDLFIVINGWT